MSYKGHGNLSTKIWGSARETSTDSYHEEILLKQAGQSEINCRGRITAIKYRILFEHLIIHCQLYRGGTIWNKNVIRITLKEYATRNRNYRKKYAENIDKNILWQLKLCPGEGYLINDAKIRCYESRDILNFDALNKEYDLKRGITNG